MRSGGEKENRKCIGQMERSYEDTVQQQVPNNTEDTSVQSVQLTGYALCMATRYDQSHGTCRTNRASLRRGCCVIYRDISLEEYTTNEVSQDLAGIELVGVLMIRRRLQRYGNKCRRDDEEDIRRVSNCSINDNRNRVRSKHRYMNIICLNKYI